MQEEIWKDVPGYEGYYQVSDLGRVKSIWYGRQKILKQYDDTRGYLKIKLYKPNGKSWCARVHRLVMIAFCEDLTLEVDHINGDKYDNRLCNLEYVTSSENCRRYASRNNKKTSKYIGVHFSKTTGKWVAQTRINGKHVSKSFKDEDSAHIGYLQLKSKL